MPRTTRLQPSCPCTNSGGTKNFNPPFVERDWRVNLHFEHLNQETSRRWTSRKVTEQRNLTPTQACPRPESLGRNLRSKTRWFTGFCNSHQVSHFATFFIDARTKISVAESHLISKKDSLVQTSRFGAHTVPPPRLPLITLAQYVPRGC
jgi:hypothetical protein